VFTPDKNPRRIVAALNELVETVRNEGISSEELEKVRNTSLTSRTFGLYSAEQIAQSIGFAETVEGDYHLWARRLRRIETLTPAEVREAARRYWRPEGAHTLVLTPKRVNPLLYLVGLFRRVSSRF
jgi:zinc protease